MRFQDLGLLPELVTNTGYTDATPVQAEAIPHVLEGRDVLAGAQTGTGKTAAFALPMLQRLLASKTLETPRALILAPTRELVAQVAQSVQTYSKGLGIRHTVIFGGVGFFPQVKALRRGIDVVIATPGRLLDHVNQRTIDLSKIEIVVLDEADRMLDMGFVHDIRKIIDLCRKDRQSLMFSATYNPPVKALAAQFLNQPVEVAVAHSQETASRIEQSFIHVDRTRKTALLTHLIGQNNWQQVLVFTKTKFGAERLATQLEIDGLPSVAMHGNKSQAQRTKALQRFKRGAVRVMVATDVAARGLDIEKLPHVINFELPMVADDYMHRIGRTGRAGETGVALSLVSADERNLFRDISRLLKKELTTTVVAGFEPSEPLFRAGGGGGGDRPRGGKPPARGRSGSGAPRPKSHRPGESSGYRQSERTPRRADGADAGTERRGERTDRPARDSRPYRDDAARPARREGGERVVRDGAPRPYAPRPDRDCAARPYAPRPDRDGAAPARTGQAPRRPSDARPPRAEGTTTDWAARPSRARKAPTEIKPGVAGVASARDGSSAPRRRPLPQ